MFMCKACGEIYDNYHKVCPRANCNGGIDDDVEDFLPVDNAFAIVIQTLQKKGYDIAYCNFGSAVNSLSGSPEIVFDTLLMDYFDKDELATIFADVPYPWKFTVIEGYPTLEAYIFGANPMERYHDFLIAHSMLAEWAENAPELVY